MGFNPDYHNDFAMLEQVVVESVTGLNSLVSIIFPKDTYVMTAMILALNAGSTSIKFSLFGHDDDLPLVMHGAVDHLGDRPVLHISGQPDEMPGPCDHARALALLRNRLTAFGKPVCCVHRFVHGGDEDHLPVRLDEKVLARLEKLVPLAPLHQPGHIAAVRALMDIWPDLPQFACFDTGFHATQDRLMTTLPLPGLYRNALTRRYGFHGLSYAWICRVLARDAPELAAGRVVIAHLGGGSSLCAVHNGRSVDTSMGMTALDGLPMSTRCGAIDPGVILYLQAEYGLDHDQMQDLLYHECGLKGLSGISGDMKTLLADESADARFAIDYYCLRVAQMVARMAVSLGGIDGLIFTGGIGTHAAPVRDRVMDHLSWLLIPVIQALPTDEERMMVLMIRDQIPGLA